MREATASAPGKVNLLLRVGPPGQDGYHPLVTVFESLDLRETVHARTTRAPGIHVRTTVRRPDGSTDRDASAAIDRLPADRHLAVRAASLLRRLAATGPWAQTASGVSLEVDKRVPVAGGMAGGSADAAATLVACNELWGLGLDTERLQALGRTLGADVPDCLVGGIALGTGHGDHMTPLRAGEDPDRASHHWVLALADHGLSTPEVFVGLDADGGPPGGWRPLPAVDADLSARLTGPAEGLAGALVNDLTTAALRLRPDLAGTMDAARDAGALDVVLSGSGPTVAALARDAGHARALAEAWRGTPGVADVLTTRGPAAGAHLEPDTGAGAGHGSREGKD